MIISSCNELRELKEEDQLTECKNVYNDLVQDKNYEKFIGFHIVRRDNENTFFYKNLKTDSSEWQPPIQYHDDIQDLDKKTISFFEHCPEAKFQFDMMLKYKIKGVITSNYNVEGEKLEYREYEGFDFNKYELMFFISDSILVSHINFDFEKYYLLIKTNYKIIERLDSTWFVLKMI